METKVTVHDDSGSKTKKTSKTTKSKDGKGVHEHTHVTTGDSSHSSTSSHGSTSSGAGGLPSSEKARSVLLETEKAIRDTQHHPPSGLDSQGKRILSDLEHLTVDQRRFIEEKNNDNVFQRFIEEAKLALTQLQQDVKTTTTGIPTTVDRATADQISAHANRILTGAQSLVQELATSSSFRQEILELIGYLVTLTEQITNVSIRRVAAPLQQAVQTAQHPDLDTKQKMKEAAMAAMEAKDTVQSEMKKREPVRPLTDEERFVLLDKLSFVIHNLTARENSRNVLRGLLDMISLFADEFEVTNNTHKAKETVQQNEHLTKMLQYLRVFLSRFTGKIVMDRIIEHAKALSYLCYEDADVRKFFQSIRKFMMRRIDQYDQYDPVQIRMELEKIVNRGRHIANTKDFGYHMSRELKYINRAWYELANDPQLVQFQRDIRQLITDLTFDKDGNFSLNTNAIQQLRIILVSTIVERMNIAIPPIQSRTEKMDFDVSNIYLEVKDIIPDQVKFSYKGHMNVDTSDLKKFSVDEGNQIKISVNNVKFSMHKLHVWWHRKSFPKTEDSGKMDIDMPGDGLDLRINLRVKVKDPNLFTVERVDASIDKLKLHVTDTKHDFLNNAFLKLAGGTIRKRIETAIQDKITALLERLNTEVSRQAKHAIKMGKTNLSSGVNKAGGRLLKPDEGVIRTNKEPTVEVVGGNKPVVHHSAH